MAVCKYGHHTQARMRFLLFPHVYIIMTYQCGLCGLSTRLG